MRLAARPVYSLQLLARPRYLLLALSALQHLHPALVDSIKSTALGNGNSRQFLIELVRGCAPRTVAMEAVADRKVLEPLMVAYGLGGRATAEGLRVRARTSVCILIRVYVDVYLFGFVSVTFTVFVYVCVFFFCFFFVFAWAWAWAWACESAWACDSACVRTSMHEIK